MQKHSPEITPDPEGDKKFLDEKVGGKKPVIKGLSAHIAKVWAENQKDFKAVRAEMVDTFRRVDGEYDSVKKSQIKAFGGCSSYFRSGEMKARTAESWIKDIYTNNPSPAWSINPTDIPDLPDDTQASIEQDVAQQIPMMIEGLAANGVELPPNEMKKFINEYYEDLLDKARKKIRTKAKDRCKRAETLIRDQAQEGGWDEAFNDFLYYFVRTKFSIIKGPVLVKKMKQEWAPVLDAFGQPTQEFELTAVEVLANDIYCPSPFNFYPSKGAKNINDCDCIEIHELSLQAVSDLIGVPGYDDEELRAVLDEYKRGELKGKWFTVDDETAVNDVVQKVKNKTSTTPATTNNMNPLSGNIFAQEFYGTVSGRLLTEWGYEGELDPHKQYQANCWKIGTHVVKAVLNQDALGRKPYHISSWAKNPAWLVGEGMIEFVAAVEDAMNAIARALINNIAIASGPMAEVDTDRVDGDTPIFPWRQIKSTSKRMKQSGPAVSYYQPQMHVQELVTAWNFFRVLLDEMTVPAYAQGSSQQGVTGGTATVFTQLLAAAARSIKAVVANIDNDIIIPFNKMSYDYNMKFSDDSSIKGDARIVANGVKSLQVKEQQSQRKVEFLQVAANPAYMELLGAENISAVLGQIAESNDIELPDMSRLDPDPTIMERLSEIINGMSGIDPLQENGQMAKGGGAPTAPQGTNPDGSKAGVANV
jgi:hypothetical protein